VAAFSLYWIAVSLDRLVFVFENTPPVIVEINDAPF
jgi:hypothetical protein